MITVCVFPMKVCWYFQYRVSGFFVQKTSMGPVTSSLGVTWTHQGATAMDLMVFVLVKIPRYTDTPPKEKTTHQVIQAVTFFGMVK